MKSKLQLLVLVALGTVAGAVSDARVDALGNVSIAASVTIASAAWMQRPVLSLRLEEPELLASAVMVGLPAPHA